VLVASGSATGRGFTYADLRNYFPGAWYILHYTVLLPKAWPSLVLPFVHISQNNLTVPGRPMPGVVIVGVGVDFKVSCPELLSAIRKEIWKELGRTHPWSV
jgi:hypothetical protein